MTDGARTRWLNHPMTDVEQWPFTAEGSVNLLRMTSSAGVKLARPERPPGLVLRELVLRGVVVPGSPWSVGPIGPLPFHLRWDAAFLQAADVGSLKSMIKASFKDPVRRRAMDLPPKKFSLGRALKEEFGKPEASEATPVPTPADEADTFTARGLAEWTETRWGQELQRTATGDRWARQGADLLSQLDDVAALTQRDPTAAARLVQAAGALVAAAPGTLAAAGQVAAAVSAPVRPTPTGHAYAFDVLAAVEALLRLAPPGILDEVSKTFRTATASTGA